MRGRPSCRWIDMHGNGRHCQRVSVAQCSPRPEGDSEVGKDGGAARGHVGEVRHGGGDAIPVDVGVGEVIFFVTGSGRDMVLAHQKLILNLMSVVNFAEPVGRARRIRVMVVHSADAVVGDLQLEHEGGCVNPASLSQTQTHLVGLCSHDSMRVQPRGQLQPQRHLGRSEASRAAVQSGGGLVKLGEPRLRARPLHAGRGVGAVLPLVLQVSMMEMSLIQDHLP